MVGLVCVLLLGGCLRGSTLWFWVTSLVWWFAVLFLDFVVCCNIDSPDSGWVSWFWWWVCFEVGFRDCFGLGGLCVLVYCRFGFRGYFGVGYSLGLLTFCLLFGLWVSIVFVVVLRVVACRCVGCWLIVVVCLLVICGFMCCGLGVE